MKDWIKKAAKSLTGKYEKYIDLFNSKIVIRIYLPKRKRKFESDIKRIKEIIPENFKLIGIFYCNVEKQYYLLINEK